METNWITGGTKDATRPAASPRGLVWGAVLLLGLSVVIGVEYSSLHQVQRLEQTLGEARPTSFLVGLRLREGLTQLSAGLLRFELSNDPAERLRFGEAGRELGDLMSRAEHSLRTEPERQLAREASHALRVFLNRAEPMLREGARGIRRNTAEQVQKEIVGLTGSLLELADQLTVRQEESARHFLAEAQQSLRGLRWWLSGSLGLFLVLLGAVAFLGHRTWVRPLQRRLDESEVLLQRQERLASLGVLTAGVAHEIRNPLAAIRFRLYSLRRSLPSSQADNEDLTIIDGEIQRLDRIVKDFLQFARPSDPDLQPIEVGSLLDFVGELLHADLERRRVRLERVSGPPLTVRADRQQLQQVLINLVQNAAEAMEPGGVVTLTARSGAARRARRVESVVLMEVADSGKGLAPEMGQRIFDPFFSTKEGGTGLGLPMAARLVELNGGFLQFASQPQRGSTFTIVLPQEMTK